MSEKRSQETKILNHLQHHLTLTPFQALSEFGCFRLAARIHDLKAQGHRIESKMLHRGGKYFAVYWMP